MRHIAVCLWVGLGFVASVASAQDDASAPPPDADEAPTPDAAEQPGSATEAPPVPASTDAAAPETYGEACVPSCRATYVCVRGQCVSACNPPCEQGLVCTEQAACEPLQTAAPPESTAAERKEARARALRQQKRDVARWREAHRYDHHLTLDGSGRAAVLMVDERDAQAGDFDSAGSGYAVLSVGYMHNTARNFGLLTRLNLGGGGVGLSSERDVGDDGGDDFYHDGDGSTGGLVELELVPYAGPVGPFYVGPLGFVGYRWYREDELRTERGGITLRARRIDDEVVAGAGVGMGVFFGAHHAMHLSWSFRSSFTETLPFEGQIGFGYRFGRFWSKVEEPDADADGPAP